MIASRAYFQHHKHNKLTSIISMEAYDNNSTTEIKTDSTVYSVQT